MATSELEREVNSHIGRRLKERRLQLGLSQAALGDMLGVSYQQIFKLESGRDRHLAGRLFVAAKALQVPLSYFFEGLGELPTRVDHPRVTLEIARGLSLLPYEQQEAISQLVRVMAAASLIGKRHSAAA